MITDNLDSFWSRLAKSIAHLGCDTDAGKLAALGGVDRLLAGQGLGFLDLAERVRGEASAPAPRMTTGRAATPSFGDLARACRDLDCGRLAPRERDFVVDMVRRGFAFRPSPR